MIEKRKVISVEILFEDGEIRKYSYINGRFNCSPNGRKDPLPNQPGSWHEYYISWYIEDNPIEYCDCGPRNVPIIVGDKCSVCGGIMTEADNPVEIRKALIAEELMKDPNFAGIMDGKAFYKKDPSIDWGF